MRAPTDGYTGSLPPPSSLLHGYFESNPQVGHRWCCSGTLALPVTLSTPTDTPRLPVPFFTQSTHRNIVLLDDDDKLQASGFEAPLTRRLEDGTEATEADGGSSKRRDRS
ncbi:unnamed protein product [Mesocestoides corti]|uniref:Uncharacterized protein n=1 Tax=Mesocestoides corti TaxID=53468 RepID=A0A158QWE3_MESCO|nr:unnamed protein product [Mesocestoides corti]